MFSGIVLLMFSGSLGNSGDLSGCHGVIRPDDGDVSACPECLDLTAGSVTSSPVPAVPVSPLEDALRTLHVWQPHCSTEEAGADVLNPELGGVGLSDVAASPGLGDGEDGLLLLEAVLARVLSEVVVAAQPELQEADMVGGDVSGDWDDLTRPVLPHNHSGGKLPSWSLVLSHRGVPGVATDPAPPLNARTPLVELAPAVAG